MTKLERLMQKVVDAENAVFEELVRLYPVGCKVAYRLREGVLEQEGEIVGHIGGREGEVRIELALARGGKRMGHSRRYTTTLQARKIIRRLS